MVEESDARLGEEIMRFALFKEVPKRERRKKRKMNDGKAVRKGGEDGETEDGESDGESDEEQVTQRMSMPPAQQPTRPGTSAPPEDPIWGDGTQPEDVDMADAEDLAVPAASSSFNGDIRPER